MKLNYKIIASSSRGNAVKIHSILVDCGCSYKKINDAIDISLLEVLLITHIHGDHLNVGTLKRLLANNLKLQIYCNSTVYQRLVDNDVNMKNITTLELKHQPVIKALYGYKYTIVPVLLFHDTPNFGYRIKIKNILDEEIKLIYITDTHTVLNIEAKDYDYIFCESNYDEDVIQEVDSFGKDRVIATHLSRQQCFNFFMLNKSNESILVELHKSSRNY